MARRTEMPITHGVLLWAVAESGMSSAEVSNAAGVEEAEFEAWLQGEAKPSMTQLRRVATKLHRQVAVFLLPRPPERPPAQVQFRHPIGAQRGRELNPVERRFLRRAKRLQDAQAWLVPELDRDRSDIQPLPLSTSPTDVARTWRVRTSVSLESQLGWRSASIAFDAWRAAVEAAGVTVVQLSMGGESCRGFSLWHDWAPLVAVNTAWSDEARIFTLFHELGHLITRTNSACAAAALTSDAGDTTERWCEAFAAAVLIPAAALSHVDRVNSLAALSDLARRLKVSLRATAIRLIELSKASWSLYEDIPPISDSKKKGGGGTGRSRREIREDEFGHRTTEIFVSAVQRDIISQSQALDYLDIPSSEFERLTTMPGR